MIMEKLLTPALLLNKERLISNCQRMQERMPIGMRLRPHMKTAKSMDVYQFASQDGFKGITVSTLAEAEYFAKQGVKDILYAVGIVPGKLDYINRLTLYGSELKVITDNKSVINELNTVAECLDLRLNLLIEIDCGGARGGVMADSNDLIELGLLIKSSNNINFCGLMTHAGHSYHCNAVNEIKEIAEQERLAIVSAQQRLKTELDIDCQILSVGSTPTATFAESFSGLTETRPGVYMFYDIDQYFIGSCQLDDIAVSVLTTVIGHNKQAGRLLIDAGGLALSKDISASEFSNETGYGWLTDIDGKLVDDAFVESVHQEHGLVKFNGDLDRAFDDYPVGSRLRVLPIHACMTVAAFEHYHVHDNDNTLIDRWSRINHW